MAYAECGIGSAGCRFAQVGPDVGLEFEVPVDAVFAVLSVSYGLTSNLEAATALGYGEDYVSFGVKIGDSNE